MTTSKQALKAYVHGMDCANCALTLQRSLEQVSGVERVKVNFTTAKLEAEGVFEPEAVRQRVEALGYRLQQESRSPGSPTSAEDSAGRIVREGGFVHFLYSQWKTRIALFATVLLVITLPLAFFTVSPVFAWVLRLTHFAVVILVGLPIARKGILALSVGQQLTIDLLMSIATLGALLIGETGEAATVILLFAFGEALEGFSAERARRSLRSLIALKPETATVLKPCIDCSEHLGIDGYSGGACPVCGAHAVDIPAAEVIVGEIVLVRPGETIPVDGVVASGVSLVNQASVTGESIPVAKQPQDPVYAGTINGEGALEIQTTSPAHDSTISRIVRLVEQAQSSRAPVERFIDRFAAWYTPLVVSVAALVAVIPPLFFTQPFFDLPGGERGWLYRSLALLIIACPCALVISTPVTIVSALTGLARRGMLVKGGLILDRLAGIKVFAFDKTGTLTRGEPVVARVRSLDCDPNTTRCESCDALLLLAAAVESRSEHPLAQAVLDETQSRQIAHRIPEVDGVTSLAGRAVQGRVNGKVVTVGSHAHGHASFDEHGSLHDQIEQAEAEGETVMLVSQADRVLGFISVSDQLRQTSQHALDKLKNIDRRFHTVMLTGDHSGAARRIAAKMLSLDEVRSGLLPGDKVATVKSLQAERGPVAMIGDGVNDAPALAASSVGIAMGGAGSAQAMETADIVLMQDDLTHLPDLVLTTRRCRKIIWQNIAFSLAVKAVFMILALPGWTTLWMAVFADMGASLIVTLNGMRMLRRS
jgi:Zn2+/Cd2+-exporting ATPase